MSTKTAIIYATNKVNSGRKDKRGNPILDVIYFFYPNGTWDEEKRTLAEAENAYPKTRFAWVLDNKG